MEEHVSIGKASKILGISISTLRRWELSGKLVSSFRTFGNHRRYKLTDISMIFSKNENKKVIYIKFVYKKYLF